ncbi:MAG: hypothetical protein WC917_03565 [Bacilli bacterium]|jgi:hypothetical protein
MNLDTFLKEHEDLIAKSVDLLKVKNKDYATDGDPLAGFKKIAKDLGISPFQVWAVFASKHWNALTNFAKDGKVESEPIEGRIIDMINYTCLLHLLIKDNDKISIGSLNIYNTEDRNIQLILTDEDLKALEQIKSMTHITPEILKLYFNI